MKNYRETSRSAWRRFEAVTGLLDREIIAIIRDAKDGIICEHIERLLRRKHQSVSGNLRHLVERGFVKHNGKYGKTESGRDAMEWVLDNGDEPPTTNAVQLPLI